MPPNCKLKQMQVISKTVKNYDISDFLGSRVLKIQPEIEWDKKQCRKPVSYDLKKQIM